MGEGLPFCPSAGRLKFFLFPILALLLLSSAISAQSIVKPPSYFYLSAYGTTVTLDNDLCFGRAYVYGDRVVLENAYLNSSQDKARNIAVSPRSPSGLDLKITQLDDEMMKFTLTAPAGISETWIAANMPSKIKRNLVDIPKMSTLEDYNGSSSSCWFYDGENIRLKIEHSSPENVQIEWVVTEAPAPPPAEENVPAPVLPPVPSPPPVPLSFSLWVGAGGQERSQFVLGEVVTVRVTVVDAYGNPVEGAAVVVQVSLPGAPPLNIQMTPLGGGVYEGTLNTSQLGEGTFLLSVSVSAPGYETPSPLTAYLTVSKPSPPPARLPVGILVFVALLLLIGLVLLLKTAFR
jgi:hypothetical protein